MAARRKNRKQQIQSSNPNGLNAPDMYDDRRTQAIVMNSLATRPGKSDRIHSATAGTNGHHRREPLNSHSVNV